MRVKLTIISRGVVIFFLKYTKQNRFTTSLICDLGLEQMMLCSQPQNRD